MSRLDNAPSRLSLPLLSVVPLCILGACGDQWNAAAHSTDARSTRVGAIVDFHEPESVKYDPDQDVYFVTYMNGFGSVKDNNGYISRVNASDINQIQTFVQGGAH